MRQETFQASASQKAASRRKILIIDDEPLLLKSLVRILRSRHQISAAIGGADALAQLDKNANYDVVICDLMMPDIDGLQIFNAIKRKFPQLVSKCIFLSGGVFTERIERFLHDRHPLLLNKPVSRDTLLDAIQLIPRTS